MGPRVSAGKKVSAPTMKITPMSKMEKSNVFVENVPADDGVIFFLTNKPPTARLGIIIAHLVVIITKASVIL